MPEIPSAEPALPSEILHLLRSSKFLHLATSYNDIPNVSLMNYTFIEDDEDPNIPEPCIIVSTAQSTQTYKNIAQNPNVAILIHDWTTAKNFTSPQGAHLSALSQLVLQLNQAELSNHSATLNGTASIVSSSSSSSSSSTSQQANGFANLVDILKEKHLKNNPEAECFIKPDNIAIIKIVVSKAKISDSTNNIQEFSDLQPRTSN
ncbi:uncharacterized protein SAPINGB_P002288 [Magnusiomyces paraingens]|uniref:Pyridoxamine 5'-phosphate oxidase N-terminal domain-containing protein n=1 Tax=Magnusiomyces paraingens TaxID=2606893 RepID=A0A5E8BJ11_9ASCO|nr:uncharacterized protein SAPINGB_P002288 [Saprochaete ingens]VVT49476.1 unnamed protein product [Saprochaete ingens]